MNSCLLGSKYNSDEHILEYFFNYRKIANKGIRTQWFLQMLKSNHKFLLQSRYKTVLIFVPEFPFGSDDLIYKRENREICYSKKVSWYT